MNNEMRQERAMLSDLRGEGGTVTYAQADDIPRLANEDTARPGARGMNGYMPRVGELFQWSGVTFRRIEGELVERAIRDGERAEVLFPVRYVKAPNNPDL